MKLYMLEYMKYDGEFWIRFFGYGFRIIDKNKNPPLFSERNGYRKVYRLGKFGLEFLKP